jgi:hypothetical protein
MKSMAMKAIALSDEVVANVGYSNKGITEKSAPKYPYCLKIYLSQDELNMLEMKDLPAVGSFLPMQAKVMVVGQRLDDGNKTLELQITDMSLGSEEKKKDPMEALYGEEKEEA